MKYITKFFRNRFINLMVSPLEALVIAVLVMIFSPLLSLVWVLTYATMFYGHVIHLAVQDWDDYSRRTPYAEADLQFKKTITAPAVRLGGLWLAVITGNVWILIASFLIAEYHRELLFKGRIYGFIY